ncbi:hypothetical protein OG21DRAFT_1491919 [Imleria badia]|nr:hypothetical protein OG21DRAFT_1491919 [Imleria badia]
MHHALEIQEILLNILVHVYPSPDLLALVRTCRAFKEPALDMLWAELDDLSPLVRCLPEASHQLFPRTPPEYSFSRPPTQTEWDILSSYTRRIRSVRIFDLDNLAEKSVTILSNPPSSAPLFPNLRSLSCEYTEAAKPLLHLPHPSLISLHVVFLNPRVYQNSLKSFPDSPPNIRRLCLHISRWYLEATLATIEPNYICRWKNLCSMICPDFALDVDTLAHLSHMPALTDLQFALSATFPVSDSPLFFSTLHQLRVQSESWQPISRLLSRTRIPAITKFAASVRDNPSREELRAFLAGASSAGGSTIQIFDLYLWERCPNHGRSEALFLFLEDLRPCMAFSNLCDLAFCVEWNVSLTDAELLVLASAWPRLKDLAINRSVGWNTRSGITPNGLVQLLHICPSLHRIALAVDTRGYTESELPPSGSLANLALRPRPFSYMNVLDSIIEEESVPVIAAFIASISRSSSFTFWAWSIKSLLMHPDYEVNHDRWSEVYRRVKDSGRLRS